MAVVAELPLRASQAEQRLSELRLALDDMRDQRDKWQAQAESVAALFFHAYDTARRLTIGTERDDRDQLLASIQQP
jgi:hypothetical protein